MKNGLKVGGKTYPVELSIKDNQSDPNRSGVIASELILRDKCDLVLVFDADAGAAIGELADARGVPTISTDFPWTGWKLSRGTAPEKLGVKSFPYTFLFFWGAGDIARNFVGQWNALPTNKVAELYLDHPSGQAFAKARPRPRWLARGYADQRRLLQDGTDDFTNQMSAVQGQATRRSAPASRCPPIRHLLEPGRAGRLRPEVCTMAAAFLFPGAVEALGDRGDGFRGRCGGRRRCRSAPR